MYGSKAQGRGEFLYDMIWLDTTDGYLLDVPLVLESEWKRRGASDDFQKLLVARAHRRVMVFVARKSDGTESATKSLIEEVDQCNMTRPGDRYLFAAWADWLKKFEFTLYVA